MLWCRSTALIVPGEEREALGRCVAGLQLCAERAHPAENPQGKDAWLYDFARSDIAGPTPGRGSAASLQSARSSLAECCLNEGDMVLLSIEGMATTCQGFRTGCMRPCATYLP